MEDAQFASILRGFVEAERLAGASGQGSGGRMPLACLFGKQMGFKQKGAATPFPGRPLAATEIRYLRITQVVAGVGFVLSRISLPAFLLVRKK